MNDEDWNLYRGLSVNDISDDESTELKLQELDNELREIDDGNTYYLFRFRLKNLEKQLSSILFGDF
jgi:hypothetical protein